MITSRSVLSYGRKVCRSSIAVSRNAIGSVHFPPAQSTVSSQMFRNHAVKARNSILLQRNQAVHKRTFTSNSSQKATNESQSTFLQRWMGQKEIPPRGTLKWYGEMTLICTVFAITGTSTMVAVRPAVSDILGLRGSMKDGPWSYRICSLVIMTPLYALNLVLIGTVFGRHFYFRHFAVKMFSRFGIPPTLMDKNFHQTAKNFRKY